MDPWPKRIDAITLFVEDLDTAKAFYRDVFELPIHFENDDSAVFKFGDTVINLLRVTNADELISPAVVASPAAGSRMVFTIGVDDVDEMLDKLSARDERGRGQGLTEIQTVFFSVYWSNASRPLSRPPKPDSLKPPNGVVMSPSE